MTVWNFSCPSDGGNYDLEIGPSQGLDPKYSRSSGYGSMPDPAHGPVVFMNPAQPVTASLKGTLLVEAEYASLGTWWQRSYPVVITDRQGRQWTVLIADLDRQRVNKPTVPWFHQWTMNVDVLSVSTP